MRKLILTSVIVLSLPVMMMAQRNDIYSSGVKSTVSAPVATAAPAVQSTVTSGPVVSSSFAERDPDEYNRRYNYASSAAAIDNSLANDVIYVHDTVFVESQLSDTKAYKEGYLDAAEDYEFAMRMLRFHSSSRLLNPRYRWTAVADIFWDPWYDPLYSPAWSYAYLDPWYYDSWYYDPWYYDPWYYDPWYPHYHGYWPGHSHTIIIAGNVGRPTDRFVPNRKLNNRWDRQLAGSSNGRVVRGTVERDPVRQAVSNRTTSSGTVGRTSSGTSRNVRVTAPSSSRTSTAVRENAATNRTQTSAERTSSVVNRSTSGTQRSASVSSSSVRNSATVNRTTQAGTTYDRPSSTSSRQTTGSTVRSNSSSSSSRQTTGSTVRSNSSSSSSRSSGATIRNSNTSSEARQSVAERSTSRSSSSSSRSIGNSSSSSFSSSSSSFSSGGGASMGGGGGASAGVSRSSSSSRR